MKLLRVLAVPAALTLVAACGGSGTPGAAAEHGREPGAAGHDEGATRSARPRPGPPRWPG